MEQSQELVQQEIVQEEAPTQEATYLPQKASADRLKRNRAAAKKCRERKSAYLKQLEKDLDKLTDEISQLRSYNEALGTELEQLRFEKLIGPPNAEVKTEEADFFTMLAEYASFNPNASQHNVANNAYNANIAYNVQNNVYQTTYVAVPMSLIHPQLQFP